MAAQTALQRRSSRQRQLPAMAAGVPSGAQEGGWAPRHEGAFTYCVAQHRPPTLTPCMKQRRNAP
jgi:hypothetical protein